MVEIKYLKFQILNTHQLKISIFHFLQFLNFLLLLYLFFLIKLNFFLKKFLITQSHNNELYLKYIYFLKLLLSKFHLQFQNQVPILKYKIYFLNLNNYIIVCFFDSLLLKINYFNSKINYLLNYFYNLFFIIKLYSILR